MVSSIKKLAYSNAEFGLRNAEFKTFEKKYIPMQLRNAEFKTFKKKYFPVLNADLIKKRMNGLMDY